MKKSTLFISFDGLSDPLGQSQILPYLCGIAGNGYQITILSCEKQSRIKAEEKAIRERISKLSIDWQYVPYEESGGFIARIQYIFQLYRLAKKQMQQKPIALVHCRSYLTALVGLRLKRKKNIPFVFDMRGFWANERIDGGIWRKSNPLHTIFYKYFKAKEKQFLQHADAVVSLTHAGLKEMNKIFPELNIPAKTTIIPCCTNTQLFQAVPNSQFSFSGINQNDHVIIYTGSIGTWYFTKEMIDCVLVWKKFIPNVKLLILTRDQNELNAILSQYSDQQKKSIVSTSASYQQVTQFLSLAKAALFFIKPAYSKIASSPTKMAECWALDLPIITNSGIGDNDLYFNQYEGGVLLNNFNDAAYEKAGQEYLQLQAKPGHYRQIALNYFDHQKAIANYTNIYNKISEAAL
ncbi:MAG: glycosyltransferase [Bacteroidota bacterium]